MKVERDELVEALLKNYTGTTVSKGLGERMRIMGLDYGSKTVGVAISDALGLTAQGIEIIRRTQENKLRQTLARIEALVKEYEVTAIVLGFPKNMNNTIGDRARSHWHLRKCWSGERVWMFLYGESG